MVSEYYLYTVAFDCGKCGNQPIIIDRQVLVSFSMQNAKTSWFNSSLCPNREMWFHSSVRLNEE